MVKYRHPILGAFGLALTILVCPAGFYGALEGYMLVGLLAILVGPSMLVYTLIKSGRRSR